MTREPLDALDYVDHNNPDAVAVDWMADVDDLIDIRAAMRRMPMQYRGIMLAYYEDDLTCPEIGARFRLSTSGVKSRLARGREVLREMVRG